MTRNPARQRFALGSRGGEVHAAVTTTIRLRFDCRSTAYSTSQGLSDVKLKVRTLDISPLRESAPQKRSGMARDLKGSHSFTCTPTRSSAIGMSHTCLYLPSYSWYSFTDPGGMEG